MLGRKYNVSSSVTQIVYLTITHEEIFYFLPDIFNQLFIKPLLKRFVFVTAKAQINKQLTVNEIKFLYMPYAYATGAIHVSVLFCFVFYIKMSRSSLKISSPQ